jgi:alanyl aminopeptidase
MDAMTSFRDPAAVGAGMQAVLSGSVALVDGYPLVVSAGRDSTSTQRMPFEFVKAHFDQMMSGHPSIFGFDFGSVLPRTGQNFCDVQSRNELDAFFGPRVGQYSGATRTLAQVLEEVDLCIANKAAQEPGVIEFLREQ